MISRDRAGAYAEGARQGAPNALQVADRVHLLSNAGDALERVLSRQHAALRAAAAAVDASAIPAERPAPEAAPAAAEAGRGDRPVPSKSRPTGGHAASDAMSRCSRCRRRD